MKIKRLPPSTNLHEMPLSGVPDWGVFKFANTEYVKLPDKKTLVSVFVINITDSVPFLDHFSNDNTKVCLTGHVIGMEIEEV